MPVRAMQRTSRVARRAQGIAEATKGVLAGKIDRQKLATLRQGQGDPESQIQALLSPEQQTAYAPFLDEEKVNSARLAANSELLQMQHTLGLGEEQQQKVLFVLYDQALQQRDAEANGPEPRSPAEALQSAMDRKIQALEGVLTPSQLAGYRQQQELQLTFVKRIVSQIEPSVASPQPK